MVHIIKFLKSFGYAIEGIIASTKGRNLRFHLFAATVVIIFSLILKLSAIEWSIILILIGSVISAEIFNSSIEELADVMKKHNQLDYQATKVTRDLAAGAVLVVAIISIIVGSIIFLPKFF